MPFKIFCLFIICRDKSYVKKNYRCNVQSFVQYLKLLQNFVTFAQYSSPSHIFNHGMEMPNNM